MLDQAGQIKAALEFLPILTAKVEQPDRGKYKKAVLPSTIQSFFLKSPYFVFPKGKTIVKNKALRIGMVDQVVRLRMKANIID